MPRATLGDAEFFVEAGGGFCGEVEVGEVGEGAAGGFEAVDDWDGVWLDGVLVEEEEAEAAETTAGEVEGVAAVVVGEVLELFGDLEGGEGGGETGAHLGAEGLDR